MVLARRASPAPGARTSPRRTVIAVSAGLGTAWILLWTAFLVQGGARRELAAAAEAAVQAANQERTLHESLAREHERLLAEHAELRAVQEAAGGALEAHAERGEALAAQLAAAQRQARRARIRAADLALDLGRLAEAAELLGDGPDPGAGLEWHLLQRTRRETLREVGRREAPLTALALAADGERWAAADLAGGLLIGSPAGDLDLAPADDAEDPIRSLAFDAAGGALVAASADWTARVHAVEDGRVLAHLAGHYGPVNAAAFVGGSQRVATAGEDGTLRLWDLAREHEELWIVEAHAGPILGLASDGRGERLASAALDLEVKLWSAASGELLHTLGGHTDWIQRLAFSADGARLASASDDGTARVWDVADGAPVAVLGDQGAPLVGVWLDERGEQALTAGEDGRIRRWEVGRGRELAGLHIGGLSLQVLAVAADGERLLLTRGEGELLLATLARPAPWRELARRPDRARALAVDARGDVALGRLDGGVELVEGRGGRTLATAELGGAPALALALAGGAGGAADGRRLVLGQGDGALWVLEGDDLGTRRELAGHDAGVVAVALSADGSRVASASHSGELSLWDALSGELQSTKPGPRQLVLAVALEPGAERGAWLAGGGLVRAWMLANGQRSAALRIPDLGRVTAAALARGGASLITVSGELVLSSFDLEREELAARAEPFAGRMLSLVLSPDGRRAVTAALDGGLDLWDARHAEHLLHLTGPPGILGPLAFTPDGRTVLAIHADGRLLAFGDEPAAR